MQQYSALAIQHKPLFSYSLSKLEICLVKSIMMHEEPAMKIIVYSDYNDIPSDIIITEGLFNPEIPKEKDTFT